MDSGNSGSMQSSSGGDEEYDSSRVDQPSSSFLMATLSSSSSIPHQQPATFIHHDPSSSNNYLNIININSFNMMPQSHLSQFPNLGKLPSGTSSSPPASGSSAHHSRPSSEQHHHPTAAVGGVIAKNPKKRTRASRRAPTTVLTTDTSNFRAMVQEFTGIPAPPFSTGSPFSSRRLEIFRSSHNLDNSLYNPFLGPAQKVRSLAPPLIPSSSSSSSSMLNHHITVDATNISTNALSSGPINYHLIPDLPLPRPPSNSMLNIQQNNQSPVLSFQSLLAQHHHQPHDLHHHNIPSLDDLGHVNTNLGGLQQDDQRTNNNDGSTIIRDDHRDQLRRFNVSSTEFDRQNKGLEISSNVSSSRAEGTTVDSWICPTD